MRTLGGGGTTVPHSTIGTRPRPIGPARGPKGHLPMTSLLQDGHIGNAATLTLILLLALLHCLMT
jgi:hypothetical protein